MINQWSNTPNESANQNLHCTLKKVWRRGSFVGYFFLCRRDRIRIDSYIITVRSQKRWVISIRYNQQLSTTGVFMKRRSMLERNIGTLTTMFHWAERVGMVVVICLGLVVIVAQTVHALT